MHKVLTSIVVGMVVALSSLVFADFVDALATIDFDCTGIVDGTIVIEDIDAEGEYRYVMCYGEEVLEHLGGSVLYQAGEDLLACIERADYSFDT
jgi:hypothetical protein